MRQTNNPSRYFPGIFLAKSIIARNEQIRKISSHYVVTLTARTQTDDSDWHYATTFWKLWEVEVRLCTGFFFFSPFPHRLET